MLTRYPKLATWLPELAALGEYRDFLFYLTRADVTTRYRNSWLGWGWHLFQPLILVFCYYLVFEKVLNLSLGHDKNYIIFLVWGILPWQFFISSLNNGSTALERYSSWVFSTTAPRIFFPLSTFLASLYYFAVQLAAAGLLFSPAGGMISSRLWLFVPCFFFSLVITWTLTLSLSLLAIRFTETRYLQELLLMVWFLLSPVFYSPAVLPPSWQKIYLVNPLALIIEGYRGAFFGHPLILTHREFFMIMAAELLFAFICSRLVWRRWERWVVDWL